MKRERFESSERVWARLAGSINDAQTKRSCLLQKETVAVLSIAVFCMLFVNYEAIKRSNLNNFIYTTYHQLADPKEIVCASDAWAKISVKLQKEE